MNNLPYINPDHELYLNVGILLIILENLSYTKRNKKILTINKIQIFYYLVSRPIILNRMLGFSKKEEVLLDDVEYYTVASISSNFDPLFDREKIKLLFKVLSSRKIIDVSYNDGDGFLFELNEEGKKIAENLTGNYFSMVRKYTKQLSLLQSESISKLYHNINLVLKEMS